MDLKKILIPLFIRKDKAMTKKKYRKLLSIGILVCGVVLITILTSYAFWQMDFSQAGTTNNTYKCFDVTFSENTEGVTQLSSYPMQDAEGLNTPAYQVTITNTCDSYATYSFNVNELNSSTLDKSHVKVAIDGKVSFLTSNKVVSTPADLESTARITYSLLTGGLNSGETITHTFRSWMAYETTEAQGFNKIYDTKITVEAVATSQPLLATVISQKVVTSGDGVYKANGQDNKETYYFKGSNPNNYLKLGDLNFRIIRVNEDGTIRVMADNPVTPFADKTNHQTVFNNSDSSTYSTSTTLPYYVVPTALNNWYTENITTYNNFFMEKGDFCNDTSYGARARRANNTQTFVCPVSTLKLKIGLISIDEFELAGGGSSYLYKEMMWTMTPYNETDVFFITDTATVSYRAASSQRPAAFPVLNLKASTTVTGEGTEDNPYEVITS